MTMATRASLLQLACTSSAPLARAAASSASRTLASAATAQPSASRDSRVLLGLSELQLQQLALDFGQERYRGKQLHHLIYKRKVKEIQEFSLMPLAFRNELQEAGWRVGRSPVYQTVTAADGTVKLLIQLEDNRLIETVGIPVQDEKGLMRLTACVSSQVGCPLRCSFCATGKGGFSRNLQPHEIVEQVLAIEDIFKHRVTNVVFMGMGEPMLNLKSVLEAHRCLNKEVQIGQRMIAISTVGVPNTIKRLASHKLQSTLAVSLHAPNQKLRETIVPSAKSYPLDALMKDCRDYFSETGRRVSFEYALLAGVNDQEEHAKELADLIHVWGHVYHVNLIPFNPIDESDYKRPYRKAILAFASALESRKITVSVRQTRGLDASAACGQLRNKFQKSPLVTESDEMESPPQAMAVSCFQSTIVFRGGYGGRERSPPRRGYGGCRRREDRNHGSLLVRNIPIDCRPDELRIQFERFGLVRDVYLPRNYYTGEPRGFAFVEFVDSQDSADALHHMDGKGISGRRFFVVVAAESRKRPEEMRHRSGRRGPSGYGGRRAYCGRSGSRSPSCSPSPRHKSGSRNRKRSRSYSPAPRRRRDYSTSPRRRPANDRSRSPPAPLEEQPGKRGSSPSPSYNNGCNPDGKERDSKQGHSSDRAYRSPSGSRSRSADGDALPVHSP